MGPTEATPSEAALQAIALSKRYSRETWALRDIDLKVARGSVTGLVGPNAAGKSTLMRAWMGFEKPTDGRVLVLGRDVGRSADDARRLIGYVPQSPDFHDGLSIDDHLRMAALLRPNLDETGAHRRLDALGVPPQRKARSLSGGQRAQVALSLALATRAPILLLDEPLADLDPLARREFLQYMRGEVAGSGTTVVLSSHVVSDIAEACDHLIVLGAGRVLVNDAIDDVLAGHRASAVPMDLPRVASFVGPTGETVTLYQTADIGGDGNARPATLEEIVLGYLVAARERNVEDRRA